MDIEKGSLKAQLESIELNQRIQADRIRKLEKVIDTRATPLWKRVVFRVDGWPSWAYLADSPSWRPWRKWFTS